MTHKLRNFSFNCRSFRSNKYLINKLVEKCDILLLQETLITDYIGNELDLITEGNSARTYIPAKQCNLSVGRPSAGIAIYWRFINNLTCETIRDVDRIIGLNLETN